MVINCYERDAVRVVQRAKAHSRGRRRDGPAKSSGDHRDTSGDFQRFASPEGAKRTHNSRVLDLLERRVLLAGNERNDLIA